MALETSNPEAVREAARRILSEPQFKEHEPTLWDKFFHYLSNPTELFIDGLEWILGHFAESGVGSVVAWLVVGFVVMAAIVLVFFLLRSTKRDSVIPLGVPGASRAQSPRELVTAAEQYEQEGEWRLAIRMRYAALLMHVANAGFVKLRPGRTAGEYLADVQSNFPTIATTFSDATRLFERVWYGDAPVTAGDVTVFRSLADDVVTKVAA